jgi:type II secretory pathway component GspD/PulD (secretin)
MKTTRIPQSMQPTHTMQTTQATPSMPNPSPFRRLRPVTRPRSGGLTMCTRRGWLVALLAMAALAATTGRPLAQASSASEQQELVAQKTFELVNLHLEQARAYEEQFDLARAERELLEARTLDPENRLVTEYLLVIQGLQSLPPEEGKAAALSAADRLAQHQQSLQLHAVSELALAHRQLRAGHNEAAARAAQKVVDRIEWTRGSMDWGDIEIRARELLASTARGVADETDAERAERERQAYSRMQSEEREIAERGQMRLEALLDAGYDRYLANDFVGAEQAAKAVLEEDPSNPYARELADASRDAQRETADRHFLAQRREQMLRWREAMEEVRIPYRDILTAPDKEHWDAITKSRGSSRALGLKADDPEVQAILARLAEQRMDADFQDMTIVQVANNIFFSTDIPVSVDPEVAQELDDAGETVSLSGLRDLPVESVLNILVDQVGENLAWTIRNGRVYITKAEKAAGNPIVRVHNIQDLTFPITDFKGNDIRDIPLPGESGDDAETTVFSSTLDRVRLISPDEVLNLVRENIARESWDASDAYSIDFVDSQNLLVIHTPEVQAQVADFLDDLRAFSTSMVTLEARFFALTDGFIEEIGTDLRGLGPDGQLGDQTELDDIDPENSEGLDNNGDGTGNPNAGMFFDDDDQQYAGSSEMFFNNPLGQLLSTVGGGAFQFTILDDTQVNIVMRAIEKSVNAFEISSPIVSVYNTQRAFVTVVNQVSFVQGFDVDVANAAFIADPNIGVVQEGIVLDVRPTISFDRKYVTLDVQATVANLVRPIREISTNLGGTTDQVTFALPQLDVQDAQTTVVVPDGGSVVLGGFKHVLYRNRTAEAPWLADIPILGFFFREKGLADEMTDLIIVMRATITDYSELEGQPVSRR